MTVETETTPAAPSAVPAGIQPQAAGPMADGQRRPARRKGEGYGRKYTPRRKVCQFCADKISYVDFKDLSRLRRHLSDRGKI
jgi:small subunit ribosomal protein S18